LAPEKIGVFLEIKASGIWLYFVPVFLVIYKTGYPNFRA
jgi:hypothetical protein